jgi:hypothetical protein
MHCAQDKVQEILGPVAVSRTVAAHDGTALNGCHPPVQRHGKTPYRNPCPTRLHSYGAEH